MVACYALANDACERDRNHSEYEGAIGVTLTELSNEPLACPR